MDEEGLIKIKIIQLRRLLINIIMDSSVSIKDTYEYTKKNINESFIENMNGLDILEKIKNKMNSLGAGMGQMFKGIFVDEAIGIGNGLALLYKNTADLMSWSREYFFSHIQCGLQFIENLSSCVFWYFLDAIIIFIKSVCLLFNLDVDYWADYFNLTPHLKYPDAAHKCYHCKRVSVLALDRRAEYIKYSFNDNLPDMFSAGLQGIMDGINMMSQ